MEGNHSVQEDYEGDNYSSLEDPLIPNGTFRKMPKPWWHVPYRYKLAFLTFLGFMNVYAMRVNLSVALVAMVNHTSHDSKNVEDACPGNVTFDNQSGQLNWNKAIQEQVLGSFFYGYIITQIPGGWLSGRYGAKWPYGIGIFCTTIFTLLTPLAATISPTISPYLVIAARIMEGLGEGVTFPAAHALFSKWAPPLERSKILTFTIAGAYFGSAIAQPISGILCDSDLFGGWPSVFYVTGLCGVLWTILWCLFAYSSPEDHPTLSQEERKYIAASLEDKKQMYSFDVPWFSVFLSLPVWAIIISHFSVNWAFYTLLTNLPTYMSDVLRFDIRESGILSALPFMVQWLICISGGQVADFLRKRGYLSTTVTRKLFNTTGLLLQASMLVGVTYAGCNSTLAVLFLTLAVGLGAFTNSGFNVNHLDIAPRYAGILMGLTNTAGTIPGFIGPLVVSAFIGGKETRGAWQKVFLLSAGIDVFGALIFLLFSSGVQQSWARADEEDTKISS